MSIPKSDILMPNALNIPVRLKVLSSILEKSMPLIKLPKSKPEKFILAKPVLERSIALKSKELLY